MAAATAAAAPTAEPAVPAAERPPCEHWLSKGVCKFGADCRFSHAVTPLAQLTSHHSHPLGPDSSGKRKRFFCDVCGAKAKDRWRCTVGCDFDVCAACFGSSSTTTSSGSSADTAFEFTAPVAEPQPEPELETEPRKEVALA